MGGFFRRDMPLVAFLMLFLTGGGNAKRLPVRPQWLQRKLNRYRMRVPRVVRRGHKTYFSGKQILMAWTSINERVKGNDDWGMARDFLNQHEKEFGLELDGTELRPSKIIEFLGGKRVEFNESYEGFPVYGGKITVILKNDGTVIRAFRSAPPPTKLKVTKPAYTSVWAKEKALEFFRVGSKKVKPDCQLMLLSGEDETKLVYVVSFPTRDPLGYWEVLVDASSGKPIGVKDRLTYAIGEVFDPDPITTGHANYGDSGYVDNYDSDSNELTSQRYSELLKDLVYDSLYHLEGPYVRITDLGGYQDPDYVSTDGSYDFTRSEQGFEAVMAYYHIDAFQRYIQDLGFMFHPDQIAVDPHGLYQDNSFYSPDEDAIYLGEGGVDDAEDADVLIHEYSHAIEKDAMGGFNYAFNESGALSEGYSDYFAGSYSDGLNSYQRDWVFNWDGHNEFYQGRVLNSPKHYPEDMTGESHKDGEIWSRCLWDILNTIGKYEADRISLMSLVFLWGTAVFKDAAHAILDADLMLNQGLHLNSLRDVFFDRGIFTPPTVTLYFPNLSVTLAQGTNERIEWGTYDPDELADHIEIYYRVGGNPPIPIALNVPTWENHFDWLVPAIESDDVKVEVRLVDGAGYTITNDISQETFRIVPLPGIEVTFPNGGELFLSDSIVTVLWNSDDPYGIVDHVDMDLSIDGGESWFPIENAQNIPNSGSFSWQVLDTFTTESRIRVKTYNERDVLLKMDASDNNFSITSLPEVTLLYPNSEEVWNEGDTVSVIFSGSSPAGIVGVSLSYSIDGGENWQDSLCSMVYGDSSGVFPTQIDHDSLVFPVEIEPTRNLRLRIELFDRFGLTALDTSRQDILVRPASPESLFAEVNAPWRKITLYWQDRSNFENSYIVERKKGSESWATVASLGENSTYCIDPTVFSFEDYRYRVWAKCENISSDTIYTYVYTGPTFDTGDTASTSLNCNAKMGYRAGLFYLALKERGYTKEELVLLTSEDGGLTWSSEPIDSAPSIINPALGVSKDGVVIAYVTRDEQEDYVKIYKGGTVNVLESSTNLNLENPAVDIYRDSIFVMWERTSYPRKNEKTQGNFYSEGVILSFPVSASPSGNIENIWYIPIVDTLHFKGIKATLCHMEDGPHIILTKSNVVHIYRSDADTFIAEVISEDDGDFPSVSCENNSTLSVVYMVGDQVRYMKYNKASGWDGPFTIAEGETPYQVPESPLVLWSFEGDIYARLHFESGWSDIIRVCESENKEVFPNGIWLKCRTPYPTKSQSYGEPFASRGDPTTQGPFSLIAISNDEKKVVIRKLKDMPDEPEVTGGIQGRRVGKIPKHMRCFLTPNPAHNVTYMRLHLKDGGKVYLRIYDTAGRCLKRTFLGKLGPGEVTVPLNLNEYGVGVLFLRLETPEGNIKDKVGIVR